MKSNANGVSHRWCDRFDPSKLILICQAGSNAKFMAFGFIHRFVINNFPFIFFINDDEKIIYKPSLCKFFSLKIIYKLHTITDL